MTDADLIKILKTEIKQAVSLRKWAAAHDLSPSFVADVLSGRRNVTDRLAAALGFRAVKTWERNGNS
jgi:hypothetical protein